MDQVQKNFRNLLGRFLLQANDGDSWDHFQSEAVKNVFYFDNAHVDHERLNRLWKLLQEVEKELS